VDKLYSDKFNFFIIENLFKLCSHAVEIVIDFF